MMGRRDFFNFFKSNSSYLKGLDIIHILFLAQNHKVEKASDSWDEEEIKIDLIFSQDPWHFFELV